MAVRTISFGADAGHLMERLLENAGISEGGGVDLVVQPEADAAVLELLREAAGGGWIVRLHGNDGTQIDTRLDAVAPEGLFGAPVGDDGSPIGPPVRRIWQSIRHLHIY